MKLKNKGHKITAVAPGSIGEELELEPGDVLLTIDGEEIEDIFDYDYMTDSESPFSVVVLGKFRRFLLVIFLSLFLHLDFSFIYSKFSMPFWLFLLKKFF